MRSSWPPAVPGLQLSIANLSATLAGQTYASGTDTIKASPASSKSSNGAFCALVIAMSWAMRGDVTADLLKRLGMNVDFLAIDWGTVGARRAMKTPPGHGGWQMFHTWLAGGDCVAPNAIIRANGDMAWFGWPDVPEVEREVTNWFDAKSLDEEKAAIRRLNQAAMESVVYAPTGFFLMYQAWRRNVTGIVQGPLPFFWGVSKSV